MVSTLLDPSLKDGLYTLTLSAANIGGGILNGGLDQSLTFKRLFGDGNGDATVDANDLATMGNAIGSTFGGTNYKPPSTSTPTAPSTPPTSPPSVTVSVSLCKPS